MGWLSLFYIYLFFLISRTPVFAHSPGVRVPQVEYHCSVPWLRQIRQTQRGPPTWTQARFASIIPTSPQPSLNLHPYLWLPSANLSWALPTKILLTFILSFNGPPGQGHNKILDSLTLMTPDVYKSHLRHRSLPPRLSRILTSSALLRDVRWFETDVSGLSMCPIFKGQTWVDPWIWDRQVAPKRQFQTTLRRTITQSPFVPFTHSLPSCRTLFSHPCYAYSKTRHFLSLGNLKVYRCH